MSILKFSDGVEIDTSGELRRLELSDGLYVVGMGKCIPVNSEEEVTSFIEKFKFDPTKENHFLIPKSSIKFTF